MSARPNPDAQHRIAIIATVNGAPGPFDGVDSHADYRVDNPACVPMTPGTGATVVPQQRVPVLFPLQADGAFRADVARDPFRDEDYFEQGICHWVLVGVVADKPTAFNHPQETFSIRLRAKNE